MTDELKHRFQQLIADPPPPSTTPRDAVFGRIRKAKRRRTAGVSAVAAAVAVAAVVALSNVTDIRSEPPLIGPPPSSVQSSTPTPAPPKIGVTATLTPKLTGRTMTLTIKVAGTVMLPLDEVGNPLSRKDEFLNFATGGTEYHFGDKIEEDSGSDAGAIICKGAKQQITGSQTYSLPAHTYARPGTYTITYKATFCGPNDNPVTATQTTTVHAP
ncbi:hypothetical protein OG394_35355 [Kribbella sp. NBC_01245]|uniref:hypothetical protein n=1 Tax=Kribbella sp. NBC_01245 TaxID=2903578 RepID=UPI002E2BB5C0|nr:hypothetical protein [Kribbella sp. NBC_01245]